MKNKEYLLCVVAIGLTMVLTGCGCGSSNEQNVEEIPVAVESVEEAQEEGYKIVDVDIPYSAMVTKDVKLIEDLETNAEGSSEVVKETFVTVTSEVFFNRVLTDYYRVTLDDGSAGFIEGENLDFNVTLEQDYADSLEEIEGGDGEEVEETTEEVVEETTVEEVEAFEPYMMYTNTNCNVRAEASKNSELVGTCVINTEVRVVGIEGDWSKVEYNGIQAFIKSSLLSKTKTEVKAPSSNSGSNSDSTNGGTQTHPSNPTPSGGAGTVAGGDPFGDAPQHTGGSGGYDGGSTGGNTDGEHWGGAY